MVSMENSAPNPNSALLCAEQPQTRVGRAVPLNTRSPIRKKAKRHRKQTMTSRLSDSGIEEDLAAPQSPRGGTAAEESSAAGQLGLLTWHEHYGDAGYEIQRDHETQFHLPRCLARQPQLTPEARCKLVSWLIPVHKYFRLSFECCCLAVNIMDRFLASTAVAADCFQLLGVTALLLASKQVEVFSPRISQLLGLCCHAFTKEQLCNLECLILLRLHFRLAAPTLAFFLEYNIHCAAHRPGSPAAHRPDQGIPPRRQDLARRICELSLADYAFNRYRPSLTAACALRLSAELQPTPSDAPALSQSESGRDSVTRGSEPSDDERSPSMDRSPDRTGAGCGRTAGGGGEEEEEEAPGHSQRVARECRENLRLLVSLNRETLQPLMTDC